MLFRCVLNMRSDESCSDINRNIILGPNAQLIKSLFWWISGLAWEHGDLVEHIHYCNIVLTIFLRYRI